MFGENQLNIPEELGFPFSGKVRLFPLPNFVLFPNVIRGLHIFEPRYCAMLEEALATDKLITMATLCDGWEANYQGAPKIYPLVCIGKIIRHQPTGDGRHNILLEGRARANIVKELELTQTFRSAEVQILGDKASFGMNESSKSNCSARGLQRIYRCISKFFPSVPLASLVQQQALSNSTVNALTYLLAGLLPLPVETQLVLLAEQCPSNRLSLLEEWLAAATGHPLSEFDDPASPESNHRGHGGEFPPNFSLN